MRLIFTFLTVIFLSFPLYAQQPQADSKNEVKGLKIPPAKQVEHDEGFITLEAECEGEVRWLVLSTSQKIKFRIPPTNSKEITIAIPPNENVITVFCIGVVAGKPTDFARTEIDVKGPPAPTPDPPNPPQPPVINKPLHLSIIEDSPAQRTPQLAAILTSADLQNRLRTKDVRYRLYVKNDPQVVAKRFADVVNKHGTPILILQDKDGKALLIQKLPATLEELYRILAPYTGNL